MIYNQFYIDRDTLLNFWETADDILKLDLNNYGYRINGQDNQEYKKLGIQSSMGTKFRLVDNNNNETYITLGKTGIFELDLTNFSRAFIKEIYVIIPLEGFIPKFVLVDVIKQGGN